MHGLQRLQGFLGLALEAQAGWQHVKPQELLLLLWVLLVSFLLVAF